MNILKLKNNKITSLQIVEEINFFRRIQINLNTEKKLKELLHKNLLAVIRDEFSEEIGELKIKPTFYIDKSNRKSVMFELTINQAKQILVRESKVVRKAVIKRLEELENKILMPSYQIEDPIERAKSWIKEQEVLKELEYKNKEQEMLLIEHEPKIEYYDSILNSNDLLTITQIAKDYNLSGQALNKILHEEKIQYKQSGQWLLYVNHAVKGYTKSQTIKYFDKEGIERTKLLTKWRQKGRLMIHKLLTDKGIMANMDQ